MDTTPTAAAVPEPKFSTMEAEIEAMRAVGDALRSLDPFTIRRVMDWARARFEDDLKDANFALQAQLLRESVERNGAAIREQKRREEASASTASRDHGDVP